MGTPTATVIVDKVLYMAIQRFKIKSIDTGLVRLECSHSCHKNGMMSLLMNSVWTRELVQLLQTNSLFEV